MQPDFHYAILFMVIQYLWGGSIYDEETEEMARVGQEVNELYSEEKISDRWNSFLDNVFVDKIKK